MSYPPACILKPSTPKLTRILLASPLHPGRRPSNLPNPGHTSSTWCPQPVFPPPQNKILLALGILSDRRGCLQQHPDGHQPRLCFSSMIKLPSFSRAILRSALSHSLSRMRPCAHAPKQRASQAITGSPDSGPPLHLLVALNHLLDQLLGNLWPLVAESQQPLEQAAIHAQICVF